MTTWAGVVRVSHMGHRRKDAEDFHAERDQITAMREAIQRLGGTLHILPSELDVSGGLPLEQRPAMLAAVQGVESGKYDGIVVAYQSRIGRDVEVEESIWKRVERAGGQILMALDGLDTSTVDGKMVRRIKSAINTREREAHAERFEALRKWATAAGIWQRRQTPIGYRKDPSTRKLTPNGDAARVHAAFRARAAGDGMTAISRRLGMTPSGAQQMIRNRVYLGELKVGQHVNVSAHPPLVDPDLWLAAQRPERARPARSQPEPALLAGLVRCCGCGHVMSRSGTTRIVYSCRSVHSSGTCAEPAAIACQRLDDYTEAVALTAMAAVRATVVRDTASLGQTRDALRQAEAEMAAYLEGMNAAQLGPETIAIGARSRQDAIDVARQAHQRALAARADLPPVDVIECYPELSMVQRNHALRGILECVLVARVGRGRVLPVEDRVRVIRAGAGVTGGPYRGGGEPVALRRIELPDLDDPRVLRM